MAKIVIEMSDVHEAALRAECAAMPLGPTLEQRIAGDEAARAARRIALDAGEINRLATEDPALASKVAGMVRARLTEIDAAKHKAAEGGDKR